MNKIVSRRDILRTGAAASLLATVSPASLAQQPVYKQAVAGRPIPPKNSFNKTTTAELVTDGMDLAGQVALVTGCNSGLGYETMRVLALRGAHVFGAARTEKKAAEACASVEGETTPLVVELTDLPGIRAAARGLYDMDVSIDMLILNAGIMAVPDRRLANGVELQFAVNHLGHFLLANLIMDQVIAAPAGRVVVVSSAAHAWGPEEGIRINDLAAENNYDPFMAYGQSKVANGLFSRELARRLADTSATSNSLHPGVIQTNLGRFMPERDEDDVPTGFQFKTIPEGAATQVYVSTHPQLNRVTGWYFADCNPAYPNEHMQDDELAARLWSVSEELVGDYLP